MSRPRLAGEPAGRGAIRDVTPAALDRGRARPPVRRAVRPRDPDPALHCTLSPVDLDWLAGRRGAANRLGAAVQLCLLRHPGFGLRAEENPPEGLLAWRARQLDVPAAARADYARRDQTRREQDRKSVV